jgi:two-component system phosphate regulon response regulator OmpR
MTTTCAAAPQKKLLVVDDDRQLRELLQRYLADNGFEVTAVNDGIAMQQQLDTQTFDLVILDLMLPGDDGLTLTQQLRRHSELPIIMLSARGEEVDRIIGIEMGADDYLAKPFNPRELLARIRSLLRRCQISGQPEALARNDYRFAHFRLDLTTRELFADGAPVELTHSEFTLLNFFLENPETTLSRDALTQELKGYERQPYDRSIDVQVTRLRKKIEPDPAKPVFIRTLWGKGYVFTPGGTVG